MVLAGICFVSIINKDFHGRNIRGCNRDNIILSVFRYSLYRENIVYSKSSSEIQVVLNNSS